MILNASKHLNKQPIKLQMKQNDLASADFKKRNITLAQARLCLIAPSPGT